MTDYSQHWQQIRENNTSRQNQLAQAAATLHLDWENLEVLSQQVHYPATARLLAEVVAAKVDPAAGEMALDLLAQIGRDQDYQLNSKPTNTAQANQPDYEEITDLENGFLFTPLYRQPFPLEQRGPWWDDQQAIEQVCQVWGEYNYPSALTHLIEKKGWTARAATTPTEVRLLTALVAGETSQVTTELTASPLALQLLVELAQSYRDQNLPQGKLQTMSLLNSSSVETLLEDRPELAETAYQYIQEQLPSVALPALALLWSKQRQPYVLEVLKRYQYLPEQPPYVGVLLALAAGEQEFLPYEGGWIVAPLVRCLKDNDSIIAGRATRILATLENKEAIDTLCQLVCEEEVSAQVQSIAKEAGYLPTALPARALYLFMTGQWEAYEALDFPNFELLTALYATATPRLRRRIAAQVRRSGNSPYVRIVTSQPNSTGLVSRSGSALSLTLAEGQSEAGAGVGEKKHKIAPSAWRAAATSSTSSVVTTTRPRPRVSSRQLELELDLLSLNQQWETLWQRVFEWPVAYALRALLKLEEAGWQPPAVPGPTRVFVDNTIPLPTPGPDEEEGTREPEPATENSALFQRLKELAQTLINPQARENGFSQWGADQWLRPAYPHLTLELASVLGRSKLSGLVFVDLPGSENEQAGRSGLVLAAGRKLVIYDHLKAQLVNVVVKASPARIEQLLYLASPNLPTGGLTSESGWVVWTDETGVLWGSSVAELMVVTTAASAFKPQKLGQHSQPVKALFTAPLPAKVPGREAETETGRTDYLLPTHPYPAHSQWFSLQADGRLSVWQWADHRGEVTRREIELGGNWEGATEVVWAISPASASASSPAPHAQYLVIAAPGQQLAVVEVQKVAVVANLPEPTRPAAAPTTNPFVAGISGNNSGSTINALAFTPDGRSLLALTSTRVSSARGNKSGISGTGNNSPQLELFEMNWSDWLATVTTSTSGLTGPNRVASQQSLFHPLALPALASQHEADKVADEEGRLTALTKPARTASQVGGCCCWLQLFKEPAGDTLIILANGPAGYISFIELGSGLELGRVQAGFSRVIGSGGGNTDRYLATVETQAKLIENNSQRRGSRKDKEAATTAAQTATDKTLPPAQQKTADIIRVWDSRSLVHLKELLFERGPVVGDIDSLVGLELLMGDVKQDQALIDQFFVLPSGLQTALRWLQMTLPYKFRHLIELELVSQKEGTEFDIELA